MSLRRRAVLALAPSLGLSVPAIAQDMRARTLRFVPSTDLVSLDPVLSTALVAVQHGFHVFDTLYGVDGQMRARPQMAEGHQISPDGRAWTIRLREGLLFHDGEPVRSRDCAASLERWARRDTFGRVYQTAVEAYETPDDRTLVIRLKRPFPMLADALAKPHSQPAFIMPERIVRAAGDSAITEITGSGPYRFLRDEWSSGNLIAYGRFDGYRPRSEAPEWTSGAKVTHFERVEWRVIADKATAVAALVQGEVDWMEALPADPARRGVEDLGAKAGGIDVGEIVRNRRLPGHRAAHRGTGNIDETIHACGPCLVRISDQVRIWTMVCVMLDAVSIAFALAWKLRWAEMSATSSSVMSTLERSSVPERTAP